MTNPPDLVPFLTQAAGIQVPVADVKEAPPTVNPNLTALSQALDIQHPSTHIVVGSTNTGKTNLMKCVLVRAWKEQQFDRIVVLVGAPDRYNDYKYVPPEYVFTEPTIQHVEEVIRQQKEEFSHVRTALVMDDCMGILEFTKKAKDGQRVAAFPALAAAARKYNISLFIGIQSLTALSPSLRASATAIWAMRLHADEIDILYKLQIEYTKPAQYRALFANRTKWDVIRVNIKDVSPQNMVFRCPKAPNRFLAPIAASKAPR